MLEMQEARRALQTELDNQADREIAKEHFEVEKAEFLQAIQENMQVLDGMLKQYTIKA